VAIGIKRRRRNRRADSRIRQTEHLARHARGELRVLACQQVWLPRAAQSRQVWQHHPREQTNEEMRDRVVREVLERTISHAGRYVLWYTAISKPAANAEASTFDRRHE
jgi:hypothetical protein